MRKLAISFGIIAIVFAAIVLVAPRLVDVNRHKDTVTRLVKQHTGRDMKIGGDIALSLFPNIALEVHQVSLANASGFRHPQMLELDSLVLKLQLMPLLRRQVVVDSLVLVKPVIFLEVNKRGVQNWQFDNGAKVKRGGLEPSPGKEPAGMIVRSPWWAAPAYAAEGQTPPVKSGWNLDALRLTSAEIRNGTLSYENRQTNKTVALNETNLKLALAGAEEPMRLSGEALWQERKIQWDIRTERLAALMDHHAEPAPVKVNVHSDLFSLKAEGKLAVRDQGAAGKMAVTFNVVSVPELLSWLKIPGTSPFQKSVDVTSDVTLAPQELTFGNLSITADVLHARGELTLNNAGATPHVRGALATGVLDLRRYLREDHVEQPVAALRIVPDAMAADEEGWSREPIDASALNSVNADIGLTLEGIQLTRLKLGKTVADVRLKNGVLSTDIKEAAFYNGAITGSMVVRALAAGIGLESIIALKQVDMEALLTGLAHYHDFRGRANLNLRVNASGASTEALINGLNGQGDVRVLDGVLRNRMLVSLIRSSQAGLQSGVDGGGGTSDTLPFSDMSGTFVIQNGVLHNQDLNMVAPSLHMTGNGLIDLPRMYINYRLKPALSKHSATDTSRIGALPLLIEGPLAAPSFRIDATAAVQDVLQNPEKTIDRLKDLKGDIKSLKGNGLEQLQQLLGR